MRFTCEYAKKNKTLVHNPTNVHEWSQGDLLAMLWNAPTIVLAVNLNGNARARSNHLRRCGGTPLVPAFMFLYPLKDNDCCKGYSSVSWPFNAHITSPRYISYKVAALVCASGAISA